MKRDLDRLARERFDVVVVGGGSHGAAAAREAARRGLATALVEQGDFACATSANSLKIIHGGLRYLQYGDLPKVREAVRARRELFRLFPHLISPLPCVVPTYGMGVRSRAAMGVALALNDMLSWDRNRGVAEQARLPRGRLLTRAQIERIAPGVPGPAPTGGALWHDGLAQDTERLVLELAAAAAFHGAALANRVRVTGFLRGDGGAIAGVIARDLMSDTPIEIRARVVLNAAGPWANELNAPLRGGVGAAPPLAKAVNILIPRPLFAGYAVGLAGSSSFRDRGRVVDSGRRFFFFVPWRGGTMIGTLYRDHEGGPGACAVTARDIEEMTAEANRIYPPARISPDEVSFGHVGLLPLASRDPSLPVEARLLKRPGVADGVRDPGVEGLVTIAGVKYTSACLVAEEAVRRVAAKLGRKLPVPEPAAAALSGAPPAAAAAPPDPAGVPARVRHAVREEMALTLGDLVFRRTGLGTFGHPGRASLEACATAAAAELGWDPARRGQEIDLVEAEFRRLTGKETA